MSDALPLPPGERLQGGRYVVERLLNRGGFGVVYAARSAGAEAYAIKEVYCAEFVTRAADGRRLIPRPDVPNARRVHQHQMQRAREEAQLFMRSTKRHPHLVPLQDVFDANGTCYLVMPLVQGESLDARALGGPLHRAVARREALTLLRQLADVLGWLHGQGLIHRDLKPENVIVQRVSGQPHAVLLDTGATRGFRRTEALHTGIQTALGAPEIFSPAELRRFGPAGPASDGFALAGMAALLLTGQRPRPWTQRLDHSDPGLPPDTPAALAAVLRRGLALTVAQRYPDVQSLVQALSNALGEDPALRPTPAPVPVPSPAAAAPARPASRAPLPLPLALAGNLGLLLLGASLGQDALEQATGALLLLLGNACVAVLALRRRAPLAEAALPLWNLRWLGSR